MSVIKNLILLFFILFIGIGGLRGQCHERIFLQPFKECPHYVGALGEGDIDWCSNAPFILIHQDDFSGSELDNKFWTSYSDCYGIECNKMENNVVENGILKIQSKYEPGEENGKYYDYTVGHILSQKAFEYGAFEIRAKIPPYGFGLWPAFWLYGKNNSTGHEYELDIFEVRDDEERRDINLWVNTHYWGKPNGPHTDCSSYISCNQDLTNGYHTYKAIWDPGLIRWYIDGQEIRRLSRAFDMKGAEVCYLDNYNSYIFSETFTKGYQHVRLNTHIDVAKTAGTMPSFDIDYLKIWQRFPVGNKTIFNSDIAFELYNVEVGNSVTINKDVSMLSGSLLKVIARYEILIEEGFEAKIGSEVELKIDQNIFN